jgi:hypothetical protein
MLALLVHRTTAGAHAYGAYVAVLRTVELAGAGLLARRSALGRRLIMAAAGFYLEMALRLAGYERSELAMGLFAVCVPAEGWVLWFLSHRRVRAHIGVREV